MGGAKVSDKIQLLENLIEKADNILIGGYGIHFFKAQGGQIGNSLCEADFLNLALEVLQKAAAKGCNIYLPQDSLAADKFAADAQIQTIESNAIPDGWMGLDIGPLAVKAFCDVIASSKTIVWNGPMGVFEFPNFANGTLSVHMP